MHHLGSSRTVLRRDHALLAPGSFVRAPLPGMRSATAIVHAAPAMGAAFTQYTAELEAGGALGPATSQRFVFVLEGDLLVQVAGKNYPLTKDGYTYLPAGTDHLVSSPRGGRAAVIEKPYIPLANGHSPEALSGHEPDLPAEPLLGDGGIEVRLLLPADARFDLAVNTMKYAPGASLPMVESHVMEHGLLMLEGGGIYRLGANWYPVAAGDFIWMAPYCPQWFGALGKTPARYLIYKDWNRHPQPRT